MDEFLSQDEILTITQEANNPIYKDPFLLTLGRKKTDIVKVTPINELIFFNGNEKTGFIHINQRHLQYQERPKWTKQKDKNGLKFFKLDKPSFFHSSIVPFFDYPKIADTIYKPENFNTQDNKSPAFVDLYSGYFYPKNYEPAPYRLLLYKDTKIVHNLYPITNLFTPNRVLNYRRGTPKGVYEVKSCKYTIEIPYFDHKQIIRYKILFIRDHFKLNEQIFINRFRADGSQYQLFFIAKRTITNQEVDQRVMWQYEFSEYPNLERIILSIDETA